MKRMRYLTGSSREQARNMDTCKIYARQPVNRLSLKKHSKPPKTSTYLPSGCYIERFYPFMKYKYPKMLIIHGVSVRPQADDVYVMKSDRSPCAGRLL